MRIKNWLPFVSGPELAILSSPGLVCFIVNDSSANFAPYIEAPPVPSPNW